MMPSMIAGVTPSMVADVTPVVTPLLFLALIIVATALASLVNTIQRRRWREQLLKLASESNMAYSPDDRFNLSDRVAQHFPIPGVASLRVIDLLYASEAGGYRYVFSAEYTNGVIRSKHRKLRAATFYESPAASDAVVWSTLTLASAQLPLIEQYKALVEAGRSLQAVSEVGSENKEAPDVHPGLHFR